MKSKILFIVSDFYHGGAQREMFELDSTIDKTKLDVSILCLSNLNKSKVFSDFFYDKHLKQNTNVYFLSDILKHKKNNRLRKVLKKLSITKKVMSKKQILLSNFIDSFGKVFFMGEYVYRELEPLLKPDYFDEIIIFIMSLRFQGEHYRNFSKNNKYLFISGLDKKEEIDFEFEGFNNYNHLTFPLSFKIYKKHNEWQFRKLEKNKKIGIFTRYNKSKPLDPFFYTLHILLKSMPNVELHVFGSGDYKKAGYNRYIDHLNLYNNVFFRGHQEDIKATINNDKLDLVWFQGYNNKPGGYAGLDVCLTGTPLLLWDFYKGKNPKINKIDEVYPHYKDLLLFVEASKSVLQNESLAKSISKKQFEKVSTERDINQNIKVIKHLFNNG